MTELADYILVGRESRSLEYKESQPWEELRLAITKTILAMTNTHQGGVMVVGMRKQGEEYLAEGMNLSHLSGFRQDDVSTYVNERASSPVEITLSQYQYENKSFIIIQVAEFAEFPVICTRDGHRAGNQVLRRGALYIRSLRRVESAEVSSEAEMREIIEHGINKGVERELSRLREWGLLGIPQGPAQPSGREHFEGQLGGL